MNRWPLLACTLALSSCSAVPAAVEAPPPPDARTAPIEQPDRRLDEKPVSDDTTRRSGDCQDDTECPARSRCQRDGSCSASRLPSTATVTTHTALTTLPTRPASDFAAVVHLVEPHAATLLVIEGSDYDMVVLGSVTDTSEDTRKRLFEYVDQVLGTSCLTGQAAQRQDGRTLLRLPTAARDLDMALLSCLGSDTVIELAGPRDPRAIEFYRQLSSSEVTMLRAPLQLHDGQQFDTADDTLSLDARIELTPLDDRAFIAPVTDTLLDVSRTQDSTTPAGRVKLQVSGVNPGLYFWGEDTAPDLPRYPARLDVLALDTTHADDEARRQLFESLPHDHLLTLGGPPVSTEAGLDCQPELCRSVVIEVSEPSPTPR